MLLQRDVENWIRVRAFDSTLYFSRDLTVRVQFGLYKLHLRDCGYTREEVEEVVTFDNFVAAVKTVVGEDFWQECSSEHECISMLEAQLDYSLGR